MKKHCMNVRLLKRWFMRKEIVMNRKKTFIVGIVGTVVTLLCCATPILVILLGAVGLGAITGYLDYVLLPALVVFLMLAFYSYHQSKKSSSKNDSCCS
ncbi:mercury resistance system transport protein MerF [Geobacillus kaustophilus]